MACCCPIQIQEGEVGVSQMCGKYVSHPRTDLPVSSLRAPYAPMWRLSLITWFAACLAHPWMPLLCVVTLCPNSPPLPEKTVFPPKTLSSSIPNHTTCSSGDIHPDAIVPQAMDRHSYDVRQGKTPAICLMSTQNSAVSDN